VPPLNLENPCSRHSSPSLNDSHSIWCMSLRLRLVSGAFYRAQPSFAPQALPSTPASTQTVIKQPDPLFEQLKESLLSSIISDPDRCFEFCFLRILLSSKNRAAITTRDDTLDPTLLTPHPEATPQPQATTPSLSSAYSFSLSFPPGSYIATATKPLILETDSMHQPLSLFSSPD
jgi:hypothetical protein